MYIEMYGQCIEDILVTYTLLMKSIKAARLGQNFLP